MKRKFLTLIAAVAAAMALALSGAEAATPETAGSLTPLMPMFDTADTGIAEYSGDIVQEDAATYDASYNTNEDVAANERDVYNYLTGTMGMNSAAASGVMASMYRESRFYVDITNDDGTAYGLCQRQRLTAGPICRTTATTKTAWTGIPCTARCAFWNMS